MRICFVGHQATKEGAGRFLLDQVDYLQAKGVTVFVILPQSGILSEALNQRGVACQIVPSPWWIKQQLATQEPDYTLTLAAARQMAAWYRQWEIDLVYTQTLVAPAGPLGAALAGKPHVWHIHEFAYNPECIEMAIPKPALAKLIDMTSNLVVFNSKAVAGEWENCFPAAKTGIVYNWTSEVGNSTQESPRENSPPAFKGSQDSFVLAVVGSVLPWKRQLDAIQALANLVQAGLDVRLLVVGPVINKEYHAQLVAFVRQNKLEERVTFVGYVEKTAAVMQSAKATLVCSRLEPFGRVTIESMSLGVTVIGADSGGTTEIIEDGVSGLLFPVGDVNALTNQIRRLVQDEPFRQCLCKNARLRAAQFSSAERAMAPLLEQLKQLVGTGNPAWPLGNLIGSGLANSNLTNPSALTFRTLIRLVLMKILRRLQLAKAAAFSPK